MRIENRDHYFQKMKRSSPDPASGEFGFLVITLRLPAALRRLLHLLLHRRPLNHLPALAEDLDLIRVG
jgi:hypothetical protein